MSVYDLTVYVNESILEYLGTKKAAKQGMLICIRLLHWDNFKFLLLVRIFGFQHEL